MPPLLVKVSGCASGEEKLGCDIVAKSLRAPVRLIASNAGVEGDVIIEKLLGKAFEIGYNAVRIPDCMPSVALPCCEDMPIASICIWYAAVCCGILIRVNMLRAARGCGSASQPTSTCARLRRWRTELRTCCKRECWTPLRSLAAAS